MYLLIYRGNKLVRSVGLTKRPMTLGRDRANDVVLDDPTLAPVHARIEYRDGLHRIRMCDAMTGQTEDLATSTERVLATGLRLRIGCFELSIERRSTTGTAGHSAALLALLHNTSLFTRQADRKMLLDLIMDCLIRTVGATRCSILLPDSAGLFHPAVTREIEPASLERAVSATFVKRALATRQLAYCPDIDLDPALRGLESLGLASVRSVACYPVNREERVEALIYLDSPAEGALKTEDASSLLEAFGAHALSALDNQQEKESLHARAGQLLQMAQDAVRVIHSHEEIVGRDPRMEDVLRQVGKVAVTEVTTLITGESGTGKELVARAIHKSSARRAGPFIAVNCGAMPRDLAESELFGHEKGAFTGATSMKPGKFELAQGGTLLLDEVGELPLEVQVKLLRVLQERVVDRVGGSAPVKVDVRLIAATNADLPAKVREKEFRDDLLYRINVFQILLPPLRDRPGDIEPLAEHFIGEFNLRFGRRVRGLSPTARKALLAYRWPGNVRELRNIIERAFVVEESELLTPGSLPFGDLASLAISRPDLPAPGEGKLIEAMESYERLFIQAALHRHGFRVAATARSLGVARQTLYNKLEQLGLKPGDD